MPSEPTSSPVVLHSVGQVTVEHLDFPPTFVKPKRIHPRRVLPLIGLGVQRDFGSNTAPLIFSHGMQPESQSDLAISTNTPLTSPGRNGTASNVGEPSAAINGDVVVFTGNWYAAVSKDAGQSFSFIDPATAFRQFDPPGSSFCCDQSVNYIPSIDTFVWLLQYGPDTGDNIQRIAFAKTADVASGKWRLFDITTAAIGAPGAFMDFPDLAVGANHLYVTTNVFGPGQQVGSAVVRIPFAGIESGQVTAHPFFSTDFQSFRVAQNCDTTAYFAAHRDSSTLEVFCWPETQDAPAPGKAVGVNRWVGGNGYQSRTPDGGAWLDRADPRITGAALAGNDLYFAWSVDQGSNHRTHAFIQIARLDARNLTLLENIEIFDSANATAYGALAANSDGEVGISYMIGGDAIFPSFAVGFLTATQMHKMAATGTRGPLPDPSTNKSEWGDYLAVRRAYPNQRLFAATGYTMEGTADGSNRDATPRFVVFGRAQAPGGGGGGVPIPPVDPGTGTTGGGTGHIIPFSDVNNLPIVSPNVAKKILAAAMQAGAVHLKIRELPLKYVSAELLTKPGVERWPVKTGQDIDTPAVGANVFGTTHYGAGIVTATVEQLIQIPRPPDMTPPTALFPPYQARRRAPVEFVVWQVEGAFILLKQETDGDYHLVLQGASGDTMIVEIPTPTPAFIGSSPWFSNIKAARAEVDRKLVAHLSPQDFVPWGGYLVPRQSLPFVPESTPLNLPMSFVTRLDATEGQTPAFKTAVKSTPVRVTGVGFFDKLHGQTGVAQLNGIELHPGLKIEWL